MTSTIDNPCNEEKPLSGYVLAAPGKAPDPNKSFFIASNNHRGDGTDLQGVRLSDGTIEVYPGYNAESKAE